MKQRFHKLLPRVIRHLAGSQEGLQRGRVIKAGGMAPKRVESISEQVEK